MHWWLEGQESVGYCSVSLAGVAGGRETMAKWGGGGRFRRPRLRPSGMHVGGPRTMSRRHWEEAGVGGGGTGSGWVC